MSKLFVVEGRIPQSAATLMGTGRWAKLFIASGSEHAAQLALSTAGVQYRAKEIREVPTDLISRMPGGYHVKNPRGVYATAARIWQAHKPLHFADGAWSLAVPELHR